MPSHAKRLMKLNRFYRNVLFESGKDTINPSFINNKKRDLLHLTFFDYRG